MTISSRSWFLADADRLAVEYKYTFYKPPPEAIVRIAPGDTVKLIFEFSSDDPEAPSAERMWVEVGEIVAPNSFRGRLDNEPYHIKDLELGDPVEFEARHIIQTPHDSADNLPRKYVERCFVTSRVLYEGAPVGYLFREEPDHDDDSGWRVAANDESPEYMDDADNIHYVSLGAVLNRDAAFVDLLDSPIGSAFFRDAETGQFVADDDVE
jgi:hypothetical protein